MSKRVWAVVKDPGGVNGVLPVVQILRERGVQVDVIAHGKAPELPHVQALDTYLVAGSDPEEILNTLPLPDAYITSMCSEGGVGRSLIPILRERDVSTVAAQGSWGESLVNLFGAREHHTDHIWVNDQLAADIVLRAWPEYAREQIWVTGIPTLDKFASVDVEGTRARVRQVLGMEEGLPLVVFAGDLQKTSKVLAYIITALNRAAGSGQQACFAPRQHPRMPDDAPEELEPWGRALAEFHAGQLLAETYEVTTPDMVAAADVVVATYSTLLIDAAALRKEVITFSPPDVPSMLVSRSGLVDELPLVTLGCATKVTSVETLSEAFLRALQEGLGLRKAQEQNFRLDGRNAERAAECVLKLL